MSPRRLPQWVRIYLVQVVSRDIGGAKLEESGRARVVLPKRLLTEVFVDEVVFLIASLENMSSTTGGYPKCNVVRHMSLCYCSPLTECDLISSTHLIQSAGFPTDPGASPSIWGQHHLRFFFHNEQYIYGG